jgi:hypothetical protein
VVKCRIYGLFVEPEHERFVEGKIERGLCNNANEVQSGQ